MSIQDPINDPRQQSYGAPSASSGYRPVSNPVGSVPPDPRPFPGYPPVPPPGAPNPGLAALLGFIPGVGAMYNGQFPKGIAHIAIFSVFCSLSKNVNGIFGLFIAGWVLYMAFEAYQTAIARRDGLPLPDPFGLNHIGERFGFRGNPDFSSFWAHGSGAGPVPPVPPASKPGFGPPPVPGAPTSYAEPAAQASYQVDPAGNVYSSAAPGYAPPVPPPPPGYSAYGVPPPPAGYPGPVYGAPGYAVPPVPPVPSIPPVPAGGLPSGALWLIGLGVFALLGSMRSFSFLEGEATGGIFLIGLALFLFWRRYSVNKALYAPGSPLGRWTLLNATKGLAILFVVGLLTLLQGLHVVNWENSWPFLLIAIGVFSLFQKFAQNGATTMPGPMGYPAAPVTAPVETPVETSSPTSIVPRFTRSGNDSENTEGR